MTRKYSHYMIRRDAERRMESLQACLGPMTPHPTSHPSLVLANTHKPWAEAELGLCHFSFGWLAMFDLGNQPEWGNVINRDAKW